MLVAMFTLATARGFAIGPNSETIQATYSQAGNAIGVTLVVYSYSTSSDLQVLSLAFQEGKDRGLATALSKTKAVGQCTIAGALGYEIAFIQMVLTPTGRRIVFITSRPHLLDESDPPTAPQPFDLAVGQFDLNDADPAKSTGFLYPASKLVVDEQGEFHYDLAGSPWALVNVLDSNVTAPITEARAADATAPDLVEGSLTVQRPLSKIVQH
jgi:hypothetical protein